MTLKLVGWTRGGAAAVALVLASAGCSGSGRVSGSEVTDAQTGDVRGAEVGLEQVSQEEAESRTTGLFGDPCQSSADCVVGWCIPTEEGGRCSDLCDDECPPGWVCRPVEGDEGKTMVCLPELARLCRPCVEDAECRIVAGVLSDHCVVYGDEGAFCGTVCSGPQECPAGYVCQWMDTVSGDQAYQCAAKDRVCECLDSWIEEGAWTHCGSTNEWGACEGTRQCELAGLSSCTAVSPAPEICNAADDDCDGNVDEDLLGESCTRENEAGKCEGEEVCLDGLWTCDAPVPAEEACNGLDDDCDGDVDEGAIDTDLDTVPDCLDTDDDNDTVEDESDNCPLQFNPDQEDLDEDGLGDACDPDMDGDGILNEADNCVDKANPLQEDLDQDGLGDACDFCLKLPDDGLDSDGDLHGDACDAFPFDPAEWSDHDEDGLGDNGDEDDFDYGKLVYTVADPDPTDLESGKEPMPGDGWPHFRHDLRRTGRSSGKGDLKAPLALWRYYLGGMLAGRKALLHDLDLDGTPELLVVSGGSVVAWRTTGEKVWESGVLGLGVEELVGAADLDGNGTAEILALRTQTSPGWWIIRAKTGQVINSFTSFLGNPSDDSSAKLEVEVLDDVTGDGLPDVVVNANNYYVATLWQIWSFPWGPEAPALWSENKSTAKQELGMAVAGDVDGDGSLELITQSFDSLLQVFEIPATKGQAMPAAISCQFCSAIGAFHVLDVDGDGADELLVVKDGPLTYCDRVGLVDFSGGKCTLAWSRFDTSPSKIRVAAPWATGVADLDGDGDTEVVLSVLDLAGDAKWHMQVLDALTGTTLVDLPDRIPYHVLDADGAGGPEILVVHSQGDKIPSGSTQVSSLRFEDGKLVAGGLALQGVLPAYYAPRYTGLLKTAVHRYTEIYTRMGEMALAGQTAAGSARGIFFSDPELDGIWNEVISVDLGTGQVLAQYADIPPGVGLGVPYALGKGGEGFLALARNDGRSLMLDFSLAAVSPLIKAGGYYNNSPRVADLDGDLVPEVLLQNSRTQTIVLHAPAKSSLEELVPQTVHEDSRAMTALVPDGPLFKMLVADRSDPAKLLLSLLHPDLQSASWGKEFPPTTNVRWVDALSVGAEAKTALVLQLQNQNDATDNSLTAISALDGGTLWSNPGAVLQAGRGGTSVDLDGLPGEEYVTCSTGNECTVFAAQDGISLYGLNKVGKYYIGIPQVALAADLDGAGPPELVTGGHYYETGTFRLDSTAPWAFTQLWESVAATQSAPALAFVDDDALPDIIYWNSEEGLVARRGLDGTVLWQIGLSGGAVVSSAVGKNIRLGHPAVGDVDGDGDDDILVGSPDGFLYCLDVKSLDMLWSIYFRTTVGEPVLADVDGKGLDEILVPVADGYVYLLDQPGD